ncbi:MAG: signal peptidase I [Spirochaetia bacterium]
MAHQTAAWTLRLQTTTERILTWRKRRRLRKKERQQKKNIILDWLEAFLWAAGVVLLINQYLLQAYRIPSGSMRDTLLEGDRIFVNKLVYGPELLPGLVKLPGFTEPKRGEVIIFENPSYISRGTAFDIVQRVLYMLTLSMVDIDRDESGQPRPHFLIKRAVGVGGDRFRIRDGELEILPKGAGEWRAETAFAEEVGLDYQIRRVADAGLYALYPDAGRAAALESIGVQSDAAAAAALREVQTAVSVTQPRSSGLDILELDRQRSAAYVKLNPADSRGLDRHAFFDLGWFVPEGRILPLGDNRDNSRDGRYFGPVQLDDVLGRAMFKYWPITRFGLIR